MVSDGGAGCYCLPWRHFLMFAFFRDETYNKQRPGMPEAKVAEEPMGLSSHVKFAQRLLSWPSCYTVPVWHSFLSLVLLGLKSVGQTRYFRMRLVPAPGQT